MKSISTGSDLFRLSEPERARLDSDGYLVREQVFTPVEVAEIIAACEALVDELARGRRGWRLQAGSYVFDPDFEHEAIIKWEGDTDVVHGVEPVAHLSPPLRRWAHDPRLVGPIVDLVGDEQPTLFTEKLNLKRPHVGGANPPHQDYPYWVDSAEVAADLATAMVLLDDSTVANGCLRVAPGSHRNGVWSTRKDGDEFLANEIDMQAYPDTELVPVELRAGSVVMFGPFLVHQSLPNRSDQPRRALLFSYQPGGRHHMLEPLRRRLAGRA